MRLGALASHTLGIESLTGDRTRKCFVSVFVLPKRLSLLVIVVLGGSSIRDCKEILVEFHQYIPPIHMPPTHLRGRGKL